MHQLVLIIIPKNIFESGTTAINEYIKIKMAPYFNELEVSPYIIITKYKLADEFEKYKEKYKYKDIKEFCEKYYGYKMDGDGNAITTENKDAFWDYYEIGGRWSCHFGKDIVPKFNLDDNINKNYTTISTLYDNYKKTKNIYSLILDQSGAHNGETSLDYQFESGNYYALKNGWSSEYESILENNLDNYVIALDCHS